MKRAIDKQTMLDLIIKAKRTDPETGSFAEWLAEYLVEHLPTLTPPNEWVNRVIELDELYTKLQIITGFTVEQLLEMFAAGYTLEKPDYSKSFEEMASLAETTPPNEALTLEELREMGGQPYWHVGLREESPPPHWNILDPFYAKRIEDYKYGENWIAYRRPPEGEEATNGT